MRDNQSLSTSIIIRTKNKKLMMNVFKLPKQKSIQIYRNPSGLYPLITKLQDRVFKHIPTSLTKSTAMGTTLELNKKIRMTRLHSYQQLVQIVTYKARDYHRN